jgi:general stress protein YciG
MLAASARKLEHRAGRGQVATQDFEDRAAIAQGRRRGKHRGCHNSRDEKLMEPPD